MNRYNLYFLFNNCSSHCTKQVDSPRLRFPSIQKENGATHKDYAILILFTYRSKQVI